MRIGILTLALHANYGGILQAYALQTVLKRMGHEAETLQLPFYRKLPWWKWPYSYPKRFVKRYLLGDRKERIFLEQWLRRTDLPLLKFIGEFQKRHMAIRVVRNFNEIKEGEYDAFVVGSDQIWRPSYFQGSVTDAYLGFARRWKEVKRVAYAASFGTDEWEYTPRQTRRCRELVKLFDAVSVRERAAVELCRTRLDCEARHLLDPTLLLTAGDYLRLVEESRMPAVEVGLLTYILDESAETREAVQCVAGRLGCVPFRANSRYEDKDAPLPERVQPPVERWLRCFQDARFVITDSFHATVFSILFGKPFLVLVNEGRGLSRLHSLLAQFGLERHLQTSGNFRNFRMEDYTYDAAAVHRKLAGMRREALEWLGRWLPL